MRKPLKRAARMSGHRQRHRLLLRRIHKLVRSKLAQLFFHLQNYRVGLGAVQKQLRFLPRRGKRLAPKPKVPFFPN